MSLGPELSAVVFGLTSAIAWGAADFGGGLATRRSSVFGVAMFSQTIGLGFTVFLAAAGAGSTPTQVTIFWGAAAGVSGAVGLLMYYRALAVGQMGINAPIAAVLSSSIPVVFAALFEGLPSWVQSAGFALAIVGIYLIAKSNRVVGPARGLALAVIAGVGFGLLFIFLDRAEPGNVFWLLTVTRLVSVLLIATVASTTRRLWRPSRRLLPLLVVVGLLDMLGNIFFLFSTRLWRLDVASVLSSMYPATTVLLAWLLLRERLSSPQILGICFTLVSIPLIGSG